MSERELTRTAQAILRQARAEAVQLGHSYVGTEHLLLALSRECGGFARRILTGAGLDSDRLTHATIALTGSGSRGCPPCQGLTSDCRKCVEYATAEACRHEVSPVDSVHLLLGLLQAHDTTAAKVLRACGMEPEALYHHAMASLGEGNTPLPFRSKSREPEPARDSRLLEQFSRDLTRDAARGTLDPVIGREAELERMMEILCRRTKNNPVLLGDPGVGKTALAEALAQAIVSGNVPKPLQGVRLLSLDLPSVVAGTKYRGEFEERLRKLLREVKRSANIILFLDELHTLVGAGSAEGAIDAANILKPALSRGEVQIIGATTQEEYRRTVCKDAALERRFQPVQVEAPTPEGAMHILRQLRPRYESHHGVVLSDEALSAAVNLSVRYLPDRFLPDKAIDLMDEAAARVRIHGRTEPEEVRLLDQRCQEAEHTLQDAVARSDFEHAAQLRDAAESFRAQLEQARSEWLDSTAPLTVRSGDVEAVLSLWTGIPVSKLTEDERTRLLRLEDALRQRIVGQDDGVRALARAIRRSRSGLQEENRPVGSFLFAGPSGVGKTELSRTLAETLFGSRDALIRLDMSEFSEGHSISRLIGSPPGYAGSEEGGQLTEAIRRRPYSVVLFDELEKASGQAWNLLLQILEDGRLTDAKGKQADFRNAVLILTTNLGAEQFSAHPLGFGKATPADYERSVRAALRQTFRPELLNRLDEVICFTPLEGDQVREIARRSVETLAARLSQRHITVDLDTTALDVMQAKCTDPAYGVRPLRRFLREEIENPTAEALLSGALKEEMRMSISGAGEHLKLSFAV